MFQTVIKQIQGQRSAVADSESRAPTAQGDRPSLELALFIQVSDIPRLAGIPLTGFRPQLYSKYELVANCGAFCSVVFNVI